MDWFAGEITEAIVKSKTAGAIFVVFIEGKDDKSQRFLNTINEPEIANIFNTVNFVSIKVDVDSLAYQQFRQIYQQVNAPSIFFIGKTGVPLEVIVEIENAANLKQKIIDILQKAGLSTNVTVSPNVDENTQTSTSDAAVNVEHGPASTSHETVETPLEEKVENAKQLVEKRREEKQKEQEQEDKLKEINRRKQGQNVQQFKRLQEDELLKQAVEERQREKRESDMARKRVLDQIAQDKAERAARYSDTKKSKPNPQASVTAKPATNRDVAHIQFRFPDGQTNTQDFPSQETLQSAYNYIESSLNLGFSRYVLSTTFPRRQFTDNDRSSTFLDLELVPTAVILVLPLNGDTVSTNAQQGLMGMLWSLLSPLFAILGTLKSFIFGSGPAATKEASDKGKTETPTAARFQNKPNRPAGMGETTVVRRQGNVHRLSNKNDSDDENNTWNGNSTQQM